VIRNSDEEDMEFTVLVLAESLITKMISVSGCWAAVSGFRKEKWAWLLVGYNCLVHHALIHTHPFELEKG
jgi:hypothetical protein